MKVYLIHYSSDFPEGDFTNAIKEIKEIVPDKILIFCLEEVDVEYIFRKLADNLSEWLIHNNKFVKVLSSNPDGKILGRRIITEKSFGYQISIYHYLRLLDQLGIDFTKIHLKSEKLFTCYNRNPKYHRAMLLDKIIEKGLLDDGVVTYLLPDHIVNDHDLYGCKSYTWTHHDGSVLKDEPDFSLSTNLATPNTFIPKSFYKGFLDIVTESHYTHHHKFLSEKTIKSIGTLKPFLSLSSPGYHRYLEEEYGIKPYTELFDYSFDWYDSLEDRIDGIVENLIRIKNLTIEERHKIHDLILPKLIENKNKLRSYSFNKEKMISPSLKFMEQTNEYTLYGDVEKCNYIFDFYRKLNWIK